MEEPLSCGPQEPIAQSVMDTTHLHTEFDQGRVQSENETATTLVTLPSVTFPIKVVVTASVAVNDSAWTITPLAVDSIPVVRTSLALTSAPAVKAYTTVFTQTTSIMADNEEFWILEGEGDIEEDPEEYPEQEIDEEDLEGHEEEWNVVVAGDDDKEEEEEPIEIADEGPIEEEIWMAENVP
ncbi:hypothetical protein ACET3Z_021184 [Daucus carota]